MAGKKRDLGESPFESLNVLKRKWKDGTFSEILEDWKWIFGYSARYKGAIVFYILMGILSTSLGLVSSVAGKYAIDVITGYETSKLWLVILIMVGSTLISLLFTSVISRVSTRLALDIDNDIRADIFDQIMDADWLSLSRYTSGDILNRFNGDVSTVSSNAIKWLPSVIIAVYQFVATFLVLFYYDWAMALIALGSAPFLLLAGRLLVRRQREYNRQVREASSDLMAFEVEAVSNFDTIKSFGVGPHYSGKIRWWQARFRDISLKYNLFSIKSGALMSLLGIVVQFVAFGYCLFRLWGGGITYGTMTLFLQQRNELSTAFTNLVGIVPSFLSSSVSAHRIRELAELPREVHLPESGKLDVHGGGSFEVRMEHVTFSYREGDQVITDSAFHAAPGEIVALVGPSGEGKTTLIRLILGLVCPGEGSVVLRDCDGREVPANAETRRLFAYVPQGNTIFSGTVAENMRLVKETATDEEIIEALKLACAWEFVEKLPEQINSPVGERGKGLSEGQAQRLALARAMLRDAPILLLDEATSALDVATERAVLRNIAGCGRGKTCIVTTHRPSVLSLCQRVYRVMDTRVTELGREESGRMAMDF
ncbi:ABC transporter ATP-binding protein [uncultured Pseudoflavonifractor sp.]|uniref:ABC transporter ATP-binding protein n=1 Tax=uncultured Pseudoflavonifractor sp. TaxID=1221379 RepID=UPI0025D241C0|nr:ABC transporter ATP-binding protein [uncultured Pseudoflavonifractor sp.]